MVSVSNVLHTAQTKTKGMKNSVKGAGLGIAATALFCGLDFLEVPGAFSLKYNTDGEKVEGTNWKSGLKEITKSAIKCAGYLVVPAAILGLASGFGVAGALIAAAGSFGSTFALSSLYEKLLPHEKEVVAKACEQKGINLNQLV